MKKEDIPILNQMVQSLEENLSHLEEAYNQKDFENFKRTKELIINLQEKILGVIE